MMQESRVQRERGSTKGDPDGESSYLLDGV